MSETKFLKEQKVSELLPITTVFGPNWSRELINEIITRFDNGRYDDLKDDQAIINGFSLVLLWLEENCNDDTTTLGIPLLCDGQALNAAYRLGQESMLRADGQEAVKVLRIILSTVGISSEKKKEYKGGRSKTFMTGNLEPVSNKRSLLG